MWLRRPRRRRFAALDRLKTPANEPLREAGGGRIRAGVAAPSAKHQFARPSADVPARVDHPCRRPLEQGAPIARAWWMVTARVVVAILVVVLPLAAPVLAHGALSMIR